MTESLTQLKTMTSVVAKPDVCSHNSTNKEETSRKHPDVLLAPIPLSLILLNHDVVCDRVVLLLGPRFG
jgi:hypothetical protein